MMHWYSVLDTTGHSQLLLEDEEPGSLPDLPIALVTETSLNVAPHLLVRWLACCGVRPPAETSHKPLPDAYTEANPVSSP